MHTTAKKLEDLKRKIDALSPAARLLMASQLVGRGDYDCVELGIVIAETVAAEWRTAQLLSKEFGAAAKL